MDQLGKDLEKIVKAGIGAVSEGLNRSAELVDRLARKGEPLYNQAVSAVSDTAGKVKKTVSDIINAPVPLDQVKNSLKTLGKRELTEISDFIGQLLAGLEEEEREKETQKEDGAEEAAERVPDGDECGGAADCGKSEADGPSDCEGPADEEKKAD